MRRKTHYVIPARLPVGQHRGDGAHAGRGFAHTLQKGFEYIENESFSQHLRRAVFRDQPEFGKAGQELRSRNAKLCTIIKDCRGLAKFSTDKDTLGDAYEYLIGQFAAGSGKKAGEFYTPQQISSILSGIVTLDSQDPATGHKKHWTSVFDFACGSARCF
jgi:type I restriction enzyme M protein